MQRNVDVRLVTELSPRSNDRTYCPRIWSLLNLIIIIELRDRDGLKMRSWRLHANGIARCSERRQLIRCPLFTRINREKRKSVEGV